MGGKISFDPLTTDRPAQTFLVISFLQLLLKNNNKVPS